VANTIEERLLRIQEQKRNITEGALGDGAQKIPKLSEDDLNFLFNPARKLDDPVLDLL
jgi:SNF2 family DNA or RNA helicase